MTDATLTGLLEQVVNRRRAALDGSMGSLDAGGLDAIATQTASTLSQRGVVASEPVLLLIGNRPADIGALLGVWRAGAVAVPVGVAAPATVRTQLMQQLGARFVVDLGAVEGDPGARSPRTIADDAALVIFTSGSTGKPKGVVVAHRRLAGKIAVLDRMLAVCDRDVVLVPLQLTFIFGLWVALLGLRAGARVVLMPRFSVAAMREALTGGASVAAVVPTMLRTLLIEGMPPAPALRMLLTGGEPCGAALAARIAAAYPSASIFDLYGSTETGSCDFVSRCDDPAQRGAIGRPTEGVEFTIADDKGRLAASGQTGELRIRTPYGMLGYLDAPDLTAQACDSGLFRTGDLVRQRADGLVELVGRRKDIISRGGVKIAPLELDQLFARHPDVEAALSGAVPDERVGEAVHVLIVARNGAGIDIRELLAWARDRLEPAKMPDAVHIVSALPTGGTGKADRGAIARLVAMHQA